MTHICYSTLCLKLNIEFLCLRRWDIDANGSCVSDIRIRKALAGIVMNRQCKSVFKRHDVSLSLKLRLLYTCWMSVITYIAESWTLTTEIEKKIDACEKGWLSRLLRTNYRDRIKDREIKERTKLVA